MAVNYASGPPLRPVDVSSLLSDAGCHKNNNRIIGRCCTSISTLSLRLTVRTTLHNPTGHLSTTRLCESRRYCGTANAEFWLVTFSRIYLKRSSLAISSPKRTVRLTPVGSDPGSLTPHCHVVFLFTCCGPNMSPSKTINAIFRWVPNLASHGTSRPRQLAAIASPSLLLRTDAVRLIICQVISQGWAWQMRQLAAVNGFLPPYQKTHIAVLLAKWSSLRLSPCGCLYLISVSCRHPDGCHFWANEHRCTNEARSNRVRQIHTFLS